MVKLSKIVSEQGDEQDATPVAIDGADDDQISNGAAGLIGLSMPYVAEITVRGTARLLMHAWNVEAVQEKADAAKNSAQKKTDDVESYSYRTATGLLGVPGAAFKASIVGAGRSMQDPRSPRKSAMDLLKAIVLPLDVVAPFIPERYEWDLVDRQRVVVQRAAVTRSRPAFEPGWTVAFQVMVNAPQYLAPDKLHQLAVQAGMFCGLLDYRPTYGRFQVTNFKVLPME